MRSTVKAKVPFILCTCSILFSCKSSLICYMLMVEIKNWSWLDSPGPWPLRSMARGDAEATHGVPDSAAPLCPAPFWHQAPQHGTTTSEGDSTTPSPAARPAQQQAAPSNSEATFSEHKARISSLSAVSKCL